MKPSKAVIFHPTHSPQHLRIGAKFWKMLSVVLSLTTVWLSVHLYSVSIKREYLCSEVFYHHRYYYFYIFKDEFPLASLPLLGYSIGRPVEVRDNQRSTPSQHISNFSKKGSSAPGSSQINEAMEDRKRDSKSRHQNIIFSRVGSAVDARQEQAS